LKILKIAGTASDPSAIVPLVRMPTLKNTPQSSLVYCTATNSLQRTSVAIVLSVLTVDCSRTTVKLSSRQKFCALFRTTDLSVQLRFKKKIIKSAPHPYGRIYDWVKINKPQSVTLQKKKPIVTFRNAWLKSIKQNQGNVFNA
jgi:hypothetical protein